MITFQSLIRTDSERNLHHHLLYTCNFLPFFLFSSFLLRSQWSVVTGVQNATILELKQRRWNYCHVCEKKMKKCCIIDSISFGIFLYDLNDILYTNNKCILCNSGRSWENELQMKCLLYTKCRKHASCCLFLFFSLLIFGFILYYNKKMPTIGIIVIQFDQHFLLKSYLVTDVHISHKR